MNSISIRDSERITIDAHKCATRLFPDLNWYDREPIALEIQDTIDEGTASTTPCNTCDLSSDCEDCTDLNRLEDENHNLREEVAKLELRLEEAQGEVRTDVARPTGKPVELQEIKD